MSIDTLIAGKLRSKPAFKLATTGSRYAVFKIGAADKNGVGVLCSGITFNDAAMAALERLDEGDSITVSGEASISTWRGHDGQQQPGSLPARPQRPIDSGLARCTRRSTSSTDPAAPSTVAHHGQHGDISMKHYSMINASIEQLCEAVTEIDSMSQTAFTEISTFAKVALGLLETPRTYEDPEILACLLDSIWDKAQDAQNYINCIAESVACNHKDQAIHRRYEALRKARESASIGGA